jgi:hypothetical protein
MKTGKAWSSLTHVLNQPWKVFEAWLVSIYELQLESCWGMLAFCNLRLLRGFLVTLTRQPAILPRRLLGDSGQNLDRTRHSIFC